MSRGKAFRRDWLEKYRLAEQHLSERALLLVHNERGMLPHAAAFRCPKVTYDSLDASDAALRRIKDEAPEMDGLRSYRCKLCARWHHGNA